MFQFTVLHTITKSIYGGRGYGKAANYLSRALTMFKGK